MNTVRYFVFPIDWNAPNKFQFHLINIDHDINDDVDHLCLLLAKHVPGFRRWDNSLIGKFQSDDPSSLTCTYSGSTYSFNPPFLNDVINIQSLIEQQHIDHNTKLEQLIQQLQSTISKIIV